MIDKRYNDLLKKVCGDIVLSENPGETMKKWREIFRISQNELSQHLKVSPSTLCDYEANRRKSPGAKVIKRFCEALFLIDIKNGARTVESLLKEENPNTNKYYELYEFSKFMSAETFVKKINGKVITNADKIKSLRIFGYTILDSLNVILNVPYNQLHQIYGDTNERALIFTGVTTGRSPMVVVRTNPIKPAIVVFINLDQVDPLAIKISEKETIPIITTDMPVQEIKKALSF
ncbi:MAG: helix-turn-helix domain-containing protein [Candidatus Micrarchaeota archaeon]|nr:helix-turn-helix domain-containing protein [Candidatus Micrarchaeota archaeon]